MERSKFFQIIPNRAGADIGSDKIFVHVTGDKVRNFSTHTRGLKGCISYLKELGVKSIAMESTGVYWINFYFMCEQAGIDAWLVNPKYTKTRSGKKTDVADAVWIQQLHSADFLEKSFIPVQKIRELREYVRTRENYIEEKARKVNQMNKALINLNIRIDNVISQIHGVSGLKLINAILSGERDIDYLISLCDTRIKKNKYDELADALSGNYQDQYLFALSIALEDFYYLKEKVKKCDKKIEEQIIEISSKLKTPEKINKAKPIRHNSPEIENFQLLMQTLTNGIDLTTIPGLTNYSVLRLISELGNDVSSFPSKKHFTSYLNLSPRQNQSGKKNKKTKKMKNSHRAGQIFRQAANSVMNSKNIGLGIFGRKLRSRKGPQVAIKALARKIAEMYYLCFTKGVEYVEKGIKTYEKKIQVQSILALEKKAKALGYQLIEVST